MLLPTATHVIEQPPVASLSVDKLEFGCGDFKVVEQKLLADNLCDDNSMAKASIIGVASSKVGKHSTFASFME